MKWQHRNIGKEKHRISIVYTLEIKGKDHIIAGCDKRHWHNACGHQCSWLHGKEQRNLKKLLAFITGYFWGMNLASGMAWFWSLNDAIGFIDSVISIISASALIFLSLHGLSKNPTKHSPEAGSIWFLAHNLQGRERLQILLKPGKTQLVWEKSHSHYWKYHCVLWDVSI